MISYQPGLTLDKIEKDVILSALKFYQNNKTRTASALNIAVRTLDNKMAKYEKEAAEQLAKGSKKAS